MQKQKDAGLQAVTKCTDKFAHPYFKILCSSYPGNVITSPFSVHTLLAMTTYGAAGRTATEMRAALKLPRNNKNVQSSYRSLLETLNNADGAELSIASKIYAASTFEIKSSFDEMITKNFLSEIEQLDFSDPAAAAKVINDWCEEESYDRITDAFRPDELSADTLLLLVNVVYFKGQWAQPFDPLLTANRSFNVDNTSKRVPTMQIQKELRNGNLPKLDAKFIEIPYEGKELSMIIILPNDINGLEKIQDNLHKVNFKRSLENEFATWTELYLPKFRIRCHFNLLPVLRKLGISYMFQEDEANFSGIGDVPLRITRAVQTAFIEVNEEGSQTFALTRRTGGGPAAALLRQFKVDRPFYYTIYHLETGISLFNGIVKHPTTKVD